MSDPTKAMSCERHGPGHATYVCGHLAHGSQQGFFSDAGSGDPRPDAWCYACDQRLWASGCKWNDDNEAAADIRLLCSGCYDEVRQRNSVTRPSLDLDGWSLGGRAEVLQATPRFVFPPEAVVASLRAGAEVKALFLIEGANAAGPYVQGERMWVSVRFKTRSGFVGALLSEPVTKGTLKPGQLVEVKHEDVLEFLVRAG